MRPKGSDGNWKRFQHPHPSRNLAQRCGLDALKMIVLFLQDEGGLHLRYGGAASLPEAYRASTASILATARMVIPACDRTQRATVLSGF
jgi:hypothetical protein